MEIRGAARGARTASWPIALLGRAQFNPLDVSFIPRAFSRIHMNLTHRTWTAVGLPDVPDRPIGSVLRGHEFRLICDPFDRYAEPEILRSANPSICPIHAGVRQH